MKNERIKKRAPHLRLVVVPAGLLLAVLGCTSRADELPEHLRFPVPQGAQQVKWIQADEETLEVHFRMRAPPRAGQVREFYGDWATKGGWELIPEEEEAWSLDRWQVVGLEDGLHDQFLVHWRSSGGGESLRLAIRQRRDHADQFVVVVRSRFESIPSEIEWMSKEEVDHLATPARKAN